MDMIERKNYEITVLPILTSCMGFYSHAKRKKKKKKKAPD